MHSNWEKGEKILYRNEVHIVLDVGPTYLLLFNQYTGQKFMLPTKQLELIEIDPLTIGLKSLPI